MSKKLYALAVTSLLFLASCTETIIEDLPPETPIDLIKYNPDITTIVSNNCLPCHAGTSASAGLNLESYMNVRNATEIGNLIERINDINNPMPQSGLMPSSQRIIFDQWILDGYLEN